MQKITLESIQKLLGKPLAAILLGVAVFVAPKVLHDNYVFLKKSYMAAFSNE